MILTELQQEKVTGCRGSEKQSCYFFSPRSNRITGFFPLRDCRKKIISYKLEVQKKLLSCYLYRFIRSKPSNRMPIIHNQTSCYFSIINNRSIIGEDKL